jgi:hypothetical protein
MCPPFLEGHEIRQREPLIDYGCIWLEHVRYSIRGRFTEEVGRLTGGAPALGCVRLIYTPEAAADV